MTIAIADSWEGRSTSATLDVAVADVEVGDIIVVYTFAVGGAPDNPTDDAGNVYVTRDTSTLDGTFTTAVSISDCRVEEVPTQVSVSNSAGGANDVAAVVMRVTHNGTGWPHSGTFNALNSTIDDPTSSGIDVVGFSASVYGEFPGPGSALLLAALTHDGATTTLAVNGAWTEVAEEEDASSGIPYSVASRVVTERFNPAPTHQWATGASRDYSTLVAGYSENITDPEDAFVGAAPSPAVTGTTLEPDFPDRFPDPAAYTYHVMVFPPDHVPSFTSCEFLRVISRTGGEWEIERGQQGTTAKAIEVGWIIRRDHLYEGVVVVPLGLVDAVANEILNEMV